MHTHTYTHTNTANPRTIYRQVGTGAQVLAFDATAEVVLSDGTTCTVTAPESHVRAKGYKHAAVPPEAQRTIPFGS